MADNGVWPSRDNLLILSDLDRRRRERVLFEHEENNVVTRSDQNIPDDHNKNWSERPYKEMTERRHHKQSNNPDRGTEQYDLLRALFFCCRPALQATLQERQIMLHEIKRMEHRRPDKHAEI